MLSVGKIITHFPHISVYLINSIRPDCHIPLLILQHAHRQINLIYCWTASFTVKKSSFTLIWVRGRIGHGSEYHHHHHYHYHHYPSLSPVSADCSPGLTSQCYKVTSGIMILNHAGRDWLTNQRRSWHLMDQWDDRSGIKTVIMSTHIHLCPDSSYLCHVMSDSQYTFKLLEILDALLPSFRVPRFAQWLKILITCTLYSTFCDVTNRGHTHTPYSPYTHRSWSYLKLDISTQIVKSKSKIKVQSLKSKVQIPEERDWDWGWHYNPTGHHPLTHHPHITFLTLNVNPVMRQDHPWPFITLITFCLISRPLHSNPRPK